MGTIQSLQQMVLGKLGVPYREMKWNYCELYIEINAKWINNLNIRIKIFEEN